MGRLDWDRLRRVRPLDGADVRIDPDGAALWEKAKADLNASPFGRRLRAGVIVRRRQERATSTNDPEAAPPTVDAPRAAGPRSNAPMICPRCGARISPRRLLRHARRCPRTPAP